MKVARRGRLMSRLKQRTLQNSRAMRFESLEPRMLLTGLPYGAVGADTGEFMLGDVVTTVVFFESDGSIDPSTEDWNPLLRDNQGNVILDSDGKTISASGPNILEETKQRVIDGMEWWEDTLANFYEVNYEEEEGIEQVHSLNFIYDFEYAHNPVATGYEPIAGASHDYVLWVEDFFREAGAVITGDLYADIRAFNHSQREAYDADWAFTIFVANDYNDLDHRFASGELRRAFAFAGGRHIVSPATRPASTFAHETGHIFYALDEYFTTLKSYEKTRGYYNTQNLNSAGNDSDGFVQQPSLMANGSLLQTAWADNISSESSLAMIGWQDSDGDGVFDVLDVPLTLSGTGYYHPTIEKYVFNGVSEVQTLVNLNSSGLRNDISVNEVSRLVYSIDGGENWLLVENYASPEVEIDVELDVAPGQSFLLRTESLDPVTGKIVTTSESFEGIAVPSSITAPGIHGFIHDDRDADSVWDSNERGVPGWTLQLVDASGVPIQTSQHLESDNYSEGTLLNNELSGVTVSAVGFDTEDSSLAAIGTDVSAAGQQVFGWLAWGTEDDWQTEWNHETRALRIDFDSSITYVSIDAIAPADGSYGRLEAYKLSDTPGEPDEIVGRVTSGPLEAGQVEKLALGLVSLDVDYVLARSTVGSTILLDNLQVGPDAAVESGDFGAYAFSFLPPGDYHVQALPSDEWEVGGPASGILDVTVDVDGTMLWDGVTRPSDFTAIPAADASAWKNHAYPEDVSDDWFLSAIDALLVINDLNNNGGRLLNAENDPPSFVDVSGDGWISPLDALRVIQAINDSVASPGVEESAAQSVIGWSATVLAGGGEGEFDGPLTEEHEASLGNTWSDVASEVFIVPTWSPPVVGSDVQPGRAVQRWSTLQRSYSPAHSLLDVIGQHDGMGEIASEDLVPETRDRTERPRLSTESSSVKAPILTDIAQGDQAVADQFWRERTTPQSERWDDILTLIAVDSAGQTEQVAQAVAQAEKSDQPG